MREMIVDAIAEPKSEDEEAKIKARNEAKKIVYPDPAYDFTQDKPDLSQRLLYILDYFPKSFDKPADMVLRVKPNDNYLTDVYNYNLEKRTAKQVTDNNSHIKCDFEGDFNQPFLLVIYDRNHSFRKNTHENSLDEVTHNKNLKGIVVAIKDWGDSTSGPINYLEVIGKEKLNGSCIIITTADALRRSGVNITLNGSLEQAVHEVVACLNHPPIQSIFDKKCDHLVVVFREVLVVHVSKLKNGTLKGAVHICPNFKRAIQAEESRYGVMPGRFAIMLTAIVKGLYHSNEIASDSDMPVEDQTI
ncbi:MAG: hypothetical protein ACXW06_08230, partial [Halobacteriota archaeon]